MSRPISPHYPHRMSTKRHGDRDDRGPLRFPWDDPDFDPEQVLADLDRMPWEDIPQELKEELLLDEKMMPPEAKRRPARSPGYSRPAHQHHPPPEEYMSLSPPRKLRHGEHGGRGDGRRRGGFREDFGSFEDGERPPHAPQKAPRERMPPVAHHQPDQHVDPSMGWSREEEQARGQGRSRGRSSRESFHDQGRGGLRDRGGGKPRGPFEDRRREDLQRERSPHDRYRREQDEAVHPGCKKEAEFRERHRSLERPREGFGGGPGERREPWGDFSHQEGRGPGEHVDHGVMNSEGPSRREPFEDRRDRGPSREDRRGRGPSREDRRDQGPSRERVHYRGESSQEKFGKSNIREEARGHPIHDALRDPGHDARRSGPIRPEGKRSPVRHEGRRSPVYHERITPMGIPPGRDGPMDHRNRGSQGHRGRGNISRGGRMDFGSSRNQPHPQPFPHGQPHAPQHQKQSVRPREPDWDIDSREEGPGWVQEPHNAPRRENDRPRGGGRGRGQPPSGSRMDPVMPRGRELDPRWNEMQKAKAKRQEVVEETLTIKVDMNRRVGQNSQLCYSSDRQLSLDLVNVGRQRLDFLPMLQHSGSYRENSMHSGTFAQEIISLVHKVKEHYFKGDSITLDQRFSGPQEGGLPEEEEEDEMGAEEERPTLNRRFHMNNMKVPDTKPLFFNMGHMQRQNSMNDPGDLRHDLERKRQERLEGVKVTIPGGSLSQRPRGPGRELNEDYVNEEEMMMPLEEDDGGFSGWSGEQDQGRRWDGHMGQRGGPFRPNMDERRNDRPQDRLGNRRNFNSANW